MCWKWIVAFIVLSRFEGVLSNRFLTALTPPVATQCGRTNLTWFGGQPPYAISLLANDTNGYSALGFANVLGTSFVTQLPFPTNKWLQMLVRDSTGAEALSTQFRVQPPTNGSTDACLLSATPVNQDNMVYNDTLKITSPSQEDTVSVCDDSFTINWQGGQPPYNLLLQTANRAVAIEQAFGGPMMNGGSINTRVQFPADFDFQVVVVDSSGTSASTGVIRLANGGENNCIISNDATTNNATNGASFMVAGPANASAIVLPTPTQVLVATSSSQPSETASESSTASATAKPQGSAKQGGMSGKTIAIASVAGAAAFFTVFASSIALYRAIRRRKASRLDLLGNSSSSSLRSFQTDLEKYKPEPYVLPTLPARGTTPEVPRGSQVQQVPRVPVREYREYQPQQLRLVNPDVAESRLLPTPSQYPVDEKSMYRHEDDETLSTFSPITIVGPSSWEDEKSMLR